MKVQGEWGGVSVSPLPRGLKSAFWAAFSALTLLVGWQEGQQTVKSLQQGWSIFSVDWWPSCGCS